MVSIKIDELNKLLVKSKTKKDGLYKSGSFYYAVKGSRLILLGDHITGEISEYSYGFLAGRGKVNTWELQKKLKELLKSR